MLPAMKVARYYLPPPAWKPNGKRTPSTWKMSAEEAQARGLKPQDIVPGSEEDRQEAVKQSAGRDGTR